MYTKRGARGAIVATILAVPAFMLQAGCGSGAKADSPYRGAYRAAYAIPSMNETGTLSFSVAQKGEMTGSFIDNNSGKTYAFNGKMEGSGAFNGKLIDGTTEYPISGTFTPVSNNGSQPGGDFRETRNGVDVRGSFSLTSTGIEPTPGSSFRGAFSGSYNVPGLAQTGVTSFSINSRGEINGSFTRGSDNTLETGNLSGSVQESGSFTATVQFTTGTVTLSGTLNPTTDGSTSGNFALVQGGQSFPGAFGSTQTAPAGDSPYQGAYRGTYGVPEKQETGNVSFTVDPRGVLTGFFSQSANQPVGTLTGAIKNDGTFNGTVTYDPTTGVAARPIVGKLGKSTVGSSSGLAGDFVWTINGVNSPGNMEISIGGSEVDSIYRGAYGGPTISDAVFFNKPTGSILDTPTSGGIAGDADDLGVRDDRSTFPRSNVITLNLTIDKQGVAVGTVEGYAFDVRITNDGRLYGTWAGFPVRGNISRQQLRELSNFSVNETKNDAGQSVLTVAYTYADKAGFAGDLIVTVNGQEYYATINGIGGNAEGAQPR